MAWHKAWRDTRWRFFTGLVLLLVLACGTIVDYRAVQQLGPRMSNLSFDISTTIGRTLQEALDTQREYRGFVWWQWFRQNLQQLWTVFAIVIGAGGLLARSTGDGARFALTLPASRRQILGARLGVGLAELAVLAVVPSLVIPLMSPAIGEHYSIVDALVHGVFLTVAGSAWFVLTVLLSTIFRDLWRPVLMAGSLALLTAVVGFSSGIGPFHVMNAASYFRSGQLPWLAALTMAVLSGALTYAADLSYLRRDI
jgi:ABC-type transport system involved in multi-copper enzyme maturation permease subunit